MFQVYQLVSNAAREGARFAAACNSTIATTPSNRTNIEAAILNNLQRANIDTSGVSVANGTISIVQVNRDVAGNIISTNPNVDPSLPNSTDAVGNVLANYAPRLAEIQVTVRVPFENVRWRATNIRMTGVTTLQATCTWYCMRDLEFQFNDQIAPQQ
jgi:hypothetical protein